jgi:acyl-CoA thioesterase I
MKKKCTYLALGDSYTIGECVGFNENFPNQLAKKQNWDLPKIIAQTGWTSKNLIQSIDKQLVEEKFDYVSLLIGVNNQYQGKSFEVFKFEFEILVKKALSLAEKQFFVLTIPNYGTSPFGKNWNSLIESEIRKYNSFILDYCKKNQIKCFDIFEISQKAKNDLTLLATDLLHPSAKMYQKWVDEMDFV